MEAVVRQMQADGRAPATIQRAIRSVLGPALREAARDRLIAAATVEEAVSFARLPRVERVERDVSPAEVERVVAAAWDRSAVLGAAAAIAARTGLRAGELCALRRADVAGDSVRVRQSLSRGGVVKGTKTGRGRSVQWDTEARAATDRWLLECDLRAVEHGATIAPDAWLLSDDPACAAPLDPGALSSRWSKHAKACNSDLNFHALRHAAASRWLHEGRSVPWVSAQLGHASPVTTLGVYAHVVDAREQPHDG